MAGKREPSHELSRIRCLKGDYAQALELVDKAMNAAARSSKAHTLRANILRRLGWKDEAGAALD